MTSDKMTAPASTPAPPVRTLVAIATYNEFENLPRLVEEIIRHSPGVELLVVDDNSPDGTGRWCDQFSTVESRFHVVHRAGKLGLGTAIVEAIRYAVEKDFDFLVTLDADFSHAPNDIPGMIQGMNGSGGVGVDVMIGSRYVPGGAVEGWPWKRLLMSRFVNAYSRFWLNLKARDCSSGFRCYRMEVLKRVPWDRMRSRGYSFLEELLWMLTRAGARIAETPIVFVNRRHGESKIDLREGFAALWILFRLRWS
jgi:dolichol-phosphate mannosyltransferase